MSSVEIATQKIIHKTLIEIVNCEAKLLAKCDYFRQYCLKMMEEVKNLEKTKKIHSKTKEDNVKQQKSVKNDEESEDVSTNARAALQDTTNTNISKSTKRLAETSSSGEEDEDTSEASAKPKRGAAKLAQMKINSVANLKLNTKIRRPKNSEKSLDDGMSFMSLTIKKEKISEVFVKPADSGTNTENANTDSENMPPPVGKPKRIRKKIKQEPKLSTASETESLPTRSTRSKQAARNQQNAQEKEEKKERSSSLSSKTRDSSNDVVIQETPIVVVNVLDSDGEEVESIQLQQQSQRKTRSLEKKNDDDDNTNKNAKQKKKPTKQAKEENSKTKREVVTEPSESANNDTQESVYEDALSGTTAEKSENNLSVPKKLSSNIRDCSVVLEKLNSTFVLSNSGSTVTLSTVTSEEPLNVTHTISTKTEQQLSVEGDSTDRQFSSSLFTDDEDSLNEESTKKPMEKKKLSSVSTLEKTPVKPNKKLITAAITSSSKSSPSSSSEKTPVKSIKEKGNGTNSRAIKTKPIFSPYGNSPVKKRVAAFEKLGTATSAVSSNVDAPTRITRTKARKMEQEQQQQQQQQHQQQQDKNASRIPASVASVKNNKYFTPQPSHKLPMGFSHTDFKYRPNKAMPSSSSQQQQQQQQQQQPQQFANNSGNNVLATATVVKATRAEMQERREEEQKRRQEREDEVKRKKEAQLQARIDEQRRKREEKQRKAQLVREAKEREKEEKIRRIIQEKEEKQQMEEQMRREYLAHKAAAEEAERKRQKEMARIKLEMERQRLKLLKKPPPLPTDDIENSDDESDSESTASHPRRKYIPPLWAQRTGLEAAVNSHCHIPIVILKGFFQMKPQTPDLRQIFEHIDESVLRRNSSAVWRTPPKSAY